MKISQNFFLFFILYLFYNIDLLNEFMIKET